MTDLRGEPGSRELASWDAYLVEGSFAKAAKSLGLHEVTVKRHVASLREANGCTTNAQLATVLARKVA